MITLTFNTKVRDAIQLIDDGESLPVLDLQGVRYFLETSSKVLGVIIFTPFDIKTETVAGLRYQYRFGMQSTLRDAILGPGPRSSGPPIITTFPEFDIPSAETGQVVPRYTV